MTWMRRHGSFRRPAVAGLFYPADPEELRTSVETLLADARASPGVARIRAIVGPRAGYGYSGAFAGAAFAALRAEKQAFRRAVVIGPAHRMRVRGVAVPSVSAFATPLGRLCRLTLGRSGKSGLPSVVVVDAPHA